MSVSRLPPPAVTRRSLLLAASAAALLPACPAVGNAMPRIVSLDYGLASTLLALGVTPLGISDLAGWEKWVVSPAMPEGVVDLGTSMEINLEVLASLRPDFILATPYLDAQIARLQGFAPVLRFETFRFAGTPILTQAIAATRKLGEAIGRRDEAELFLQGAEARFDDCRRRLSAVPQPPVALVHFMDARHVRVYGRPGLFHDVLERLGLTNAWAEDVGAWGFQTVALERLAAITDPGARLVAFGPFPADILPRLARSPLWQALPLSRPDHFYQIGPALTFGMVNEALRFAGLITDALQNEARR